MPMVFDNQTLKDACMGSDATMEKLTAIRQDGPLRGGTPGPTALHISAKHRHITNNTGIAYVWDGDTITVLALGKKHNRNTGRGDSGYDWNNDGRDAP
jgi:hypothetical protein